MITDGWYIDKDGTLCKANGDYVDLVAVQKEIIAKIKEEL